MKTFCGLASPSLAALEWKESAAEMIEYRRYQSSGYSKCLLSMFLRLLISSLSR